MRPGGTLLAPALGALLLATACSGISRLSDAEYVSDLLVGPEPAPTDPRLLPALAGRWRMQAKPPDALVPNITFVLRPDGALDFYRDDGGGTNFSSRFSGTWAASSPAPGRFEITFAFTDAEPRRRCLALPGECSEYKLPFRETWSFTEVRPDMMETPGAVWRRSEPPPDAVAAAGGYAVHVASVRDPAVVAAEWRRLAELHLSLAGLEPGPPRAIDIPGKGTFYRVVGGSLATKGEARAVCDRLKAEGRYCAVVAAD